MGSEGFLPLAVEVALSIRTGELEDSTGNCPGAALHATAIILSLASIVGLLLTSRGVVVSLAIEICPYAKLFQHCSPGPGEHFSCRDSGYRDSGSSPRLSPSPRVHRRHTYGRRKAGSSELSSSDSRSLRYRSHHPDSQVSLSRWSSIGIAVVSYHYRRRSPSPRERRSATTQGFSSFSRRGSPRPSTSTEPDPDTFFMAPRITFPGNNISDTSPSLFRNKAGTTLP